MFENLKQKNIRSRKISKFEILKKRKKSNRKKLNNSDDNDDNNDNDDNDKFVINLNNMNFNNLLSNPNMTFEIAEELGKYFLKMADKKRNKNSRNNGDDDDMNPNIKI